jgi:alkylation response protein AidB-like acyl-CoA dehydrogenase
MERTIFNEDHDLFRSSVRDFVATEIAPSHSQWAQEGVVPRAIWTKAGELGYLCMAAPEEFGGAGVSDFRYDAILGEELARQNCTGPGFGVHGTIVAPYILNYGTPEQMRRWVPGMVTGDTILAVGMTESTAGSDLASLRTTAVADGDSYIVNGHKAFVSNGSLADLLIVSCVTNPEHKQWGVSLLAIELPADGVTISTPLEKIGWHAQDTVEVFLDDVRVPKDNLIGQPGQGSYLMGKELDQERMLIAVNALASARAALDWTLAYCKEREAFGQPIGSFQNSRFRLAEMQTELTIGQVFIDRCIADWSDRSLSSAEVAMAKWWATDLQQRVIDGCLQLHGGYGYMTAYPIAQAWLDMRWTPIGGGTNEVMKDLIGRTMGL